MTRKWNDARDGATWTVTRVGGADPRKPGDAPAGETEEDPPALVFRRGEDSYALPTEYAEGLDKLSDEQLQGLLDTAREGRPQGSDPELRDSEGSAGGDAPRSPNAMGRESQPHADPRRHSQVGSK